MPLPCPDARNGAAGGSRRVGEGQGRQGPEGLKGRAGPRRTAARGAGRLCCCGRPGQDPMRGWLPPGFLGSSFITRSCVRSRDGRAVGGVHRGEEEDQPPRTPRSPRGTPRANPERRTSNGQRPTSNDAPGKRRSVGTSFHRPAGGACREARGRNSGSGLNCQLFSGSGVARGQGCGEAAEFRRGGAVAGRAPIRSPQSTDSADNHHRTQRQ